MSQRRNGPGDKMVRKELRGHREKTGYSRDFTTHLLSTRHEYDRLGLQMRFDEREKHVEFLVQFTNKIVLLQIPWSSAVKVLFAHTDVLGLLQTEASKILDRVGLGGRKEQGLARFW